MHGDGEAAGPAADPPHTRAALRQPDSLRSVLVEQVTERRRCARRTPAADERLARVRMRAGPELSVVDLSDTGALVEGTTRLLPGTRIDVHLITQAGRVLVRSRVVRAYVSLVRADGIGYRAGLAFESPVDSRPAELPQAIANGQPAPPLQ